MVFRNKTALMKYSEIVLISFFKFCVVDIFREFWCFGGIKI